MPFCASCGTKVEGQFCGTCGQPVAAPQAGPAAAPPAQAQSSPAPPPVAAGMTDNVAGLLCYICGFITGIIFLALSPYNQNKFIRFHAFQSIFLSVVWFAVLVLERIIDTVLLNISWSTLAIVGLLSTVVWLGFAIITILTMVKAYQGQRWKLPVIGDLAEKQA